METEANKMAKQPSYRFAGYTEAWEQKKLGEIVSWLKGSKLSKDRLNKDKIGYDVIHYADLYKFSDVEYDVINWTDSEDGTIIPDNSLLFPMSDVTPKGLARTSTITKTGVKAGGDVLIAAVQNHLSVFLSYQINKNHKDILPLVTGTTVKHVNSKGLSTLNINLPSLHEQTTIGSFFQDIDQLISLQQRKLEVLKEQKKTYLKLLFPAKGQTKPALRFAGFEDDWKEVKLGEVFKISSGFTGDSSLHSGSYKLTRIETISDGLINVKKLGYSNVAPDDSYKLGIGEILFSNINSIEHIGKVALYDKDYGLYHGINLLRLQPIDVNGIFSFYELGTIEKRNWARSHANKAVNQASINQTILSSLNLQIPSLPEQEVIASFFQNLDKAIAKQEEKVNQLKESKQTLLRKMFI